MRPHLFDGVAFVLFVVLRTSRLASATPPSVRAPIEGDLAKGVIVLTGDNGEAEPEREVENRVGRAGR